MRGGALLLGLALTSR